MRNLLRDSVGAIQGLRFVSVHGDAVFTLGCIGVEKAMKTMLGCNEVAVAGSWPSKKTLQYKWGHDIQKLDQLLGMTITQGLAQSAHIGYAETLASRIFESTTLPPLFATFARYGKSGRFHNLDILATDEPALDDSPSEYWERTELAVRSSQQEFREVPYGNNAALNEYEKKLRAYIAEELESWWYCIHRLGVQGVFGELGKKIGFEIWEPGRPTPSSVKG